MGNDKQEQKPEEKERFTLNFLKRIKVVTLENPWPALTLIVTILLGSIAAYYYYTSITLQTEKSLLEKPILITPDVRARGDSLADLRFVVKNPSRSIDYFYEGGSCTSSNPELFSRPPAQKPNEILDKINEDTTNSIIHIPISPTAPQGVVIPAGGEITMQCTNNYIKNPPRDGITYINVCVKIRNIQEQICSNMQITILTS